MNEYKKEKSKEFDKKNDNEIPHYFLLLLREHRDW